MSNIGWRHLTADDKSAILRGVADGKAYAGPFHAEIYPADRCNIECFFCSTAAIRGTDELSLQRIEELIDELKRAGTRSIRLAGGGEPLFHRKTKDMLRRISAARLPIENLTTNAVLLDEETAGILASCCDEVTVSLNTVGGESYSQMMQTPARNYDRVVTNVRNLISARKRAKRDQPLINLQFLVWRDNFRSLPQMYDLARELDVDAITFNGLSGLTPDQAMSDDEFAEMMRLYEDIIRRDEFRRIRTITSFEREISGDVAEMTTRISRERDGAPLLSRGSRFLRRDDYTLREKLAHGRRVRENHRGDQETASFDESCIIGWHTLVIRSHGLVAPCCILPTKVLGNIFKSSVEDIWYSEAYQKFRSELTAIMADPEGWEAGPDDSTVVNMCGKRGEFSCPMKSFYYVRDVPFVKQLERTFAAKRAVPRSS